MTSLIEENRCKLLVLDLNSQQININNDLHHYFNRYAPIELIQFYPNSPSAIIHFYSYEIVDYLIHFKTCSINNQTVRLRRFRSDISTCHTDSSTLRIKSTGIEPLTEESLRKCFSYHQSSIKSIELICHSQALITFENYDHVDQILLMPSHMFMINDQIVQMERILAKKKPRRSRWDQTNDVMTLSVRNPLMYKLVSHIEYLSKQLQGKSSVNLLSSDHSLSFFLLLLEQPTQRQQEIERLENEIVTLKNENLQLKSQKKRSFALADITNRRQQSPGEKENSIKRHRACPS
jgi:hypothetical protein